MTDILEACARAMAEEHGLAWDLLPDQPDIVCGHGMPEGCKSYWMRLARVCLSAAADNVSGDMEIAGIARLDSTNPYPGDIAENIFIAMMQSAMGDDPC